MHISYLFTRREKVNRGLHASKVFLVVIAASAALCAACAKPAHASVTMKKVAIDRAMADADFTAEMKKLTRAANSAVSNAKEGGFVFIGYYAVTVEQAARCRELLGDYLAPAYADSVSIPVYETINSANRNMFRRMFGGNPETGKRGVIINAKTVRSLAASKKNVKMVAKLRSLLKKAGVKKGISEKTAVSRINRFVIRYLRYDNTFKCNNAYQAAYKKKSACRGYADLFSQMCMYAGIQNRVVIGKANGDYGWAGHAWNQVRIGKKWYSIDVCWNDSLRSAKRYYMKRGTWRDHKVGYYTA